MKKTWQWTFLGVVCLLVFVFSAGCGSAAFIKDWTGKASGRDPVLKFTWFTEVGLAIEIENVAVEADADGAGAPAPPAATESDTDDAGSAAPPPPDDMPEE